MPQKLIFFHLLNNFTGSVQILRNVVELAVSEGYKVVVYTSETEGFLSQIDGVERRSNHYIRSNYRIITLFTFFFSQILLPFQLLRHRREQCIFYINTILPFSAIGMGKFLNKRVITHVHEYEINPKILSSFLFWIVRRFADDIIVVSHFLATSPGLLGSKVSVIPNSLSTKFLTAKQEIVTLGNPFSVLMLASLRPYKGIYEFLALAFKISEIKFTLVLSDPAEEVDLWISRLTVPSNLEIFPVQKEVIPFYQSASIIVNLAHPDKWLETFGMTVLEGMFFGLPAIVPTQGGVTELVTDHQNGFLIDYDHQDQIARQIRLLHHDSELYSRMSTNAKERSKDFSVESFNQKILQIWES
jgi:glycosyltransferase involved in cell wall biosynthesis